MPPLELKDIMDGLSSEEQEEILEKAAKLQEMSADERTAVVANVLSHPQVTSAMREEGIIARDETLQEMSGDEKTAAVSKTLQHPKVASKMRKAGTSPGALEARKPKMKTFLKRHQGKICFAGTVGLLAAVGYLSYFLTHRSHGGSTSTATVSSPSPLANVTLGASNATANATTGSSNTVAIAGGSVGGVILILAACIIFCCCRNIDNED
jgi:hypothetical protein